MPKPRIFISSTSDLSAERKALAELSHVVELYFYEKDRARKENPETHCRKMIERSHVLVGILGTEYGTPFPGGQAELSIVEWEFEVARARKELEIMAFIKKVSPETSGIDPRQQRFLARVQDFRTGVWCTFFESPQELITLLRDSIIGWLSEFLERKRDAQAPVARRSQLIAGGMGFLVFLIVLAAGGTYFMLQTYFQLNLLIGFLGIGMLTLGACILFLLLEGEHNV